MVDDAPHAARARGRHLNRKQTLSQLDNVPEGRVGHLRGPRHLHAVDVVGHYSGPLQAETHFHLRTARVAAAEPVSADCAADAQLFGGDSVYYLAGVVCVRYDSAEEWRYSVSGGGVCDICFWVVFGSVRDDSSTRMVRLLSLLAYYFHGVF